ncbi:MAG: hypothetical protein KA409_12440 [Ferruginibacter sp.]|nr:hypothetical protein [Ferruginibacter sp.]
MRITFHMHKTLKDHFFGIITVCLILVFFTGCAGSHVGSAGKGEELNMKIMENRDVVSFSQLKEQSAPSLAMRGRNKSRGLDMLVGSVASIATDAIKKVIANEQKKYIANYQFALTDLYFYDQISNDGPFDPVGMQFSGFKITRTFTNSEGEIDTAFTASFSLDTSNLYEILNNSMFRLRCSDFDLKYAKAKIAAGGAKELNMDIEITFRSSYVSSDAVLYDNVSLGKFYLFVRNAPLENSAANYRAYYSAMKGKLLTGRSFIVPRSFGYHLEDGDAKPGYSQGAYTIDVKVKESSKNVFVSKVIVENTNLMIDSYREKAVKMINRNLPGKR